MRESGIVESDLALTTPDSEPQLLSLTDSPHPALIPHGRRGEVGVTAGSGPVAGNGLGRERHHDARILAQTKENPARYPQMVAHLHALARPNLELPLSRHNLGVSPANLDARVETRPWGMRREKKR